MTTKQKLARKRLTLLQLAEKLGNVSKACRLHKVSRSQFYEYKRAFQQALEGVSVCATTVRNVWLKENLENKYKRLLRLEEKAMGKGFKLTEQQIRLLEKANPEFAERHVQSDYPGQLLCQDTFYVGRLKGVGRIYLQAAVDTYGSVAFGKLYTSKRQETTADLFYDRVLPFYQKHGLPIQAILTDNGTE